MHLLSRNMNINELCIKLEKNRTMKDEEDIKQKVLN